MSRREGGPAHWRAGAEAVLRRADRGSWRHAVAWLLVLAALAGAAALRTHGAGVSSNLLQLLPSVREDPLLGKAIHRNRDAFTQNLLVAVQGRDADRVSAAAHAAHKRLADAGYDIGDPGAAGEKLIDFYRAHRFALLTPDDTHALSRRPRAAFLARLSAGLATPASPAGTPSDPGGYFTRFLSSLPRPFPGLVPEGGVLAAPGAAQPAYLIPFSVTGQGFGQSGERRARDAVRMARAAVGDACPGCRVYASGAALYAAAERAEAKSEVSWLSTAATILIVLLVLGVFRSIRPLALTVVCLGGGIVSGAAATLVIFRDINLLTLVFGTTLLGIAVDYAFHYLTDHRLSAEPGSLQRVTPGLALGLVTSLVAFAFLAATPFPALRQIAAFSIAGLAGAFLTVIAVFPAAAGRRGRGAAPPLMRNLARLSAGRGRRWRALVTGLLVAAAVGGLFRLNAVDDLRELQALPQRLVTQTQTVNRLLGTPPASGFLFVRGTDLGQALARERALDRRASQRLPGAVLVGLAGFVPAPSAQRAALAAWHAALGRDGSRLVHAVGAAGLPAELVKPLAAEWRKAPRATVAPADVLAAAPALERFAVSAGGETGLVVQVFGHASAPALRALAGGVAGTRFVDPLGRLNAAFARIRTHATLWVAVGYAVIFLLLILRYGLAGGTAAMIPPAAAAVVTLGVLGWIGQPVNVFVVVALMLVAGIGVDYAVFLREGAGRHHEATALAVALAAVTTLASFGLLGASRIPAIHAFGLAVAVGIVVSWVAAPLALAGARRRGA